MTDTEQGDEDSPYEVEVTRSDGSQVDVPVDRNLSVVDRETDDDTGEEDSD